MKDADLIQALKQIKVQTGGLICLGCGHEAGCGVHGCAVIREAAQRLEERRTKSPCKACGYEGKHLDAPPCTSCPAHPKKPTHIDREAWKPCIKCNGKCYFCKFNETSKCGKCKNHEFYSPMFNFCPECGRPLAEKAWAELEKRLRGAENEAV